MSADAPCSVAIFLGPSLPAGAAAALTSHLDTRYLQPAQFGDVYRLIGSGVRAIVLLDGVFHGRAPVWQRELLCALRSGIRVYGAASMGALRAAELHAYGMVGLGTVFTWYSSGEIDGDDEVALLHAGPEQEYRPLTIPLVNVRGTLHAAVARSLIVPEVATEMIAHLKALPFSERTAETLWNAPACQALGPQQRTDLCAFFAEDAVDVKGSDAALALAEVARREAELPTVEVHSGLTPPAAASHHDRFRLLWRGFPRPGGEMLDGAALVERLLAEPAQRRLLRWSFSARFFVEQWARDSDLKIPAEALASSARAMWRPAQQLRENSLTAAESNALQRRHAVLAWVLEQPAEQFGLSSSMQDCTLLLGLPELSLSALRPVCSRATIARSLPYVARWCERFGAAPPPAESTSLAERWRDSLAQLEGRGQAVACTPFLRAVWALEQGPVYFGYATWSLASELLSELQRSGAAASLAAQWDGSGT